MALDAIHRMALAHVQKVGKELLVQNANVLIICMEKIVKIHANVRRKIRKCVIHGLENVIVKLVGAVISIIVAIVHARSSNMVKIVLIIVNVKIVHNVHQSMVVVLALKVFAVRYVINLVQKTPMVQIVPKNVNVQIMQRAAQRQVNAFAPLDGKAICVIVLAIQALMEKIVYRNVIV